MPPGAHAGHARVREAGRTAAQEERVRDDAPPLPGREPTTRELAAQLPAQVAALLRQEMILAKAEMFATARRAGAGSALLGAGGALGAVGALAFVAAAIAGVAVALPVWAAALIIGGALGVAGGVITIMGVRRLPREGRPLPLTRESLHRDLEELKEAAATAKNPAKGTRR